MASSFCNNNTSTTQTKVSCANIIIQPLTSTGLTNSVHLRSKSGALLSDWNAANVFHVAKLAQMLQNNAVQLIRFCERQKLTPLRLEMSIKTKQQSLFVAKRFETTNDTQSLCWLFIARSPVAKISERIMKSSNDVLMCRWAAIVSSDAEESSCCRSSYCRSFWSIWWSTEVCGACDDDELFHCATLTAASAFDSTCEGCFVKCSTTSRSWTGCRTCVPSCRLIRSPITTTFRQKQHLTATVATTDVNLVLFLWIIISENADF